MIEIENSDNQNLKDEKYILHINNFEGSLDLLWHLIKKAKIDITEISISEITEQYIEYLRLMSILNIKVASEFVLMASELLYYKSKALLPGLEIEDEYFIPPLPADLIQKLLEFKKFQETSKVLKDNYNKQLDFYTRNNENSDITDEADYTIEATLFDLINTFSHLLDSNRVERQDEIVFDEVLVSDRIKHISELMKTKERIIFSVIFSYRHNTA